MLRIPMGRRIAQQTLHTHPTYQFAHTKGYRSHRSLCSGSRSLDYLILREQTFP